MLLVVDVPDHPLGNVQTYEVAPLTAATENVSKLPLHIAAGPLIVPGVAGAVETVTASVCGDELPQLLFAVTVIAPPVVPAVAVMLAEVEVPDHPPGNVHV